MSGSNLSVLEFCQKDPLHDIFSIPDVLVLLTTIFGVRLKHLPSFYTSAKVHISIVRIYS
jgi:hypothetical protein